MAFLFMAHSIYNGEHLWSLLPQSMQLWWIDVLKSISFESINPYANVDIETPTSIFIDKTIDTEKSTMISIHNNYQKFLKQ